MDSSLVMIFLITTYPSCAHEPLTRGRETRRRGANSDDVVPSLQHPRPRMAAAPATGGLCVTLDPSVFERRHRLGTATLTRNSSRSPSDGIVRCSPTWIRIG